MAGVPKLIILTEQFRGKVFELTKDLYTVGRVDERDICIKDPSISSYHCDFIKKGSTYLIRDRNSTNGSRVNNSPITEQELKGGDMLQIGNVEILYDCETKSPSSISKTVTGITFDTTDLGSATLNKLASSGYGKKPAKKPVLQIVLFAGLGLLIVAIVALIVIILMKV